MPLALTLKTHSLRITATRVGSATVPTAIRGSSGAFSLDLSRPFGPFGVGCK